MSHAKENSSPAKYLKFKVTAMGKIIVLDSEAGVQFPKLIAVCFFLLRN